MKKVRNLFAIVVCLALIAGCGGGSKKSNGNGGGKPPVGGDTTSWIETFDKVPDGTDIRADQSKLDKPNSFSPDFMQTDAKFFVGTSVGGPGTLALDNRKTLEGLGDDKGVNSLRFAFDIPGLSAAINPKLILTIKNDNGSGQAVEGLKINVGDSFSTGGNPGVSGHRAHGEYFITNSAYEEVVIDLNTSFINTERIQIRPVVGTSGNAAAGIYIDKIEVTGIPSEKPKYTLTTSVTGSGSVSPEVGTYDSGTTVTLTATPATGWIFSTWSGALTGSDNPATLTMNDNKSVTANFVVAGTKYTLTTNVSGNGTINPSGGSYDAGTVVNLEAIPDSGWKFIGWSGALTGTTNPADLTMDGNKSVTAEFEEVLSLPTVKEGDLEINPGLCLLELTGLTLPANYNGFRFGSGITFDSNTKRYNDVDYEARIKTNGTGPGSDRIVSFTATAGDKVNILALAAGSGAGRNVMIAPVNEGTVDTTSAVNLGETNNSSLVYVAYNIPSTGDYAIYSSSSGINFYYISVTTP